ncbi:MAG: hypothetical protein J6K25_02385 [Thermoguttaceae bacterium]|nr:hypothetical protein [Thermoguttaceae bacterium]
MTRSFRLGPTVALVLASTLSAIFALSSELDAAPPALERPAFDASGLEPTPPEPSWRETFETPGVSWRYLYQEGEVEILEHRRVDDFAFSGKRSERLRYEAKKPGVVVFGHYCDYPAFYNETAPSVRVRADRPGVSLAALVVFPKTLRPDTKTPLTALLPGSTYTKTGEWERLGFPQDFQGLLDETTRALRGEHRIPVDADGAYIRQLVLITEARRGTYSLWLDDLEIVEHIPANRDGLRLSERGARFNPTNLLSCRLKLTETPIFWRADDANDSSVYGEEPFAIDREQAEKNERVPLVFARDAVAPPPPSPASAASRSTRPKASYEQALAVLPSLSPEPFAPASPNALLAAAPRSDDAVGQVAFAGSDAPNAARVASADYAADPSNDVRPPVESPTDELVSGSGTLADPFDAATEDFARPGERLVADARFGSGGRLETANGRVYALRAVESQNEPFAFLKKLGFNAVVLQTPPTAAQLKEANDAKIWLIAPAPIGAETVRSVDFDAKTPVEETAAVAAEPRPNPADSSVPEYFAGTAATDAYDPVLLWHMGTLKRSEIAAFRLQAAKIRALDPRDRPLVGALVDGLDEYSQDGGLDALILDRRPMQTSLDLNAYGDWLVDCQYHSTNPSVVFWCQIQTQPAFGATRQRQAFGVVEESPGVVSFEQMRQQARLATRAGCRSLFFASRSRLDAKDRATQYRAAALELLNLELQTLAPWVALGVAERETTRSNSPTLGAVVSRAKHASLVAPISLERNNQFAMGQTAVNNWSATIATPEGYAPDLLLPGALRKVQATRRAGGSAFNLDEGSLSSLLVYTQSDLTTRSTAERAATFGPRMAELAIKLARMRLDLYEETVYRLRYLEERGASPRSAPRSPNLGSVVEKTNAALLQADRYLELRDDSEAYLAAERATRELRAIERQFWSDATRNELTRPTTPLSTSFYDMPEYLELYENIISGSIRPVGDNLIRGGGFENAATWNADGWRLNYNASPTVSANVSFENVAARSGSNGLRVVVSAAKDRAPVEVEAPAATLETEFQTRVGQTICVQGWIKIPQTLTNSVDGVKIYDDQGGEALALRFRDATDWRRFAFYRRAINDGTTRLRFEFSGLGEVLLDDVVAQIVE